MLGENERLSVIHARQLRPSSASNSELLASARGCVHQYCLWAHLSPISHLLTEAREQMADLRSAWGRELCIMITELQDASP